MILVLLIPFVFAAGVFVGQKGKVDIALYESELVGNLVDSMSTYLAIKNADLAKLKDLSDQANLIALNKLLEQEEYTPDQEYYAAKVRTLSALAEYWAVNPPANPFTNSARTDAAALSQAWIQSKVRIDKLLQAAREKCHSEPSLDCKSPAELLN